LLWLGNFKTSGCLVGRPTCAPATTRLTLQLVGISTITYNLRPYTHKQSSTPYHWLTPGYYKDKVKTNVFLLPPHMWPSQHPLKIISAPQVKTPYRQALPSKIQLAF